MQFASNTATLFVLQSLDAGGKFGIFLLCGEVGDENANHSPVTRENGDRHTGCEDPVVQFAETHFPFAGMSLYLFEKLLKQRGIIGVNAILEAGSDQRLDRRTEQRCKTGIAVDDFAVRVEHGRALLHALHQRAVRQVGILQRIDRMAFAVFDDKSIDAAAADRIDDLRSIFSKGICRNYYVVAHGSHPGELLPSLSLKIE